ncbi:unnamed protein product [Tilletia controversa]|uniref:rRNA-processing protein EFG1 n=3 Tax=Tilletia TaxID=13289 RepID=A0A8X7MRE3_9BASI|nr:hypothetical protein CF336_g4770 [Tilletia laevis]KAE8195666.1 hypothetical protein CF328_g4362 [Tilletia controversa]KAE8259436.1 hypothetical protein A4X03_0g4091 [Tilletia caries]KAE8200503.1 hypothetical protein CF335_g3944 [Tilletia laevis]KAE8246118.1 hypothetical protein A4X06_0g5174 [Tilletia controversa]
MGKDFKGKGKAVDTAAATAAAGSAGRRGAQNDAQAGKKQTKPYAKQPAAAGQPPRNNSDGSGGPRQNHNRANHAHQHANGMTDAPALPGLNKLKASIRQTKRLLAREDLNPETRQEAERKLIALDEDVKSKEAENLARDIGAKNKKMIFFDSIKATRKIRTLLTLEERAEKMLASGEDDQAEWKTKLEETKAQLQQFRVILNYTLHWPPLERYSRFYKTAPDFDPAQPSKQRGRAGAKDDEDDDEEEDDEESDSEDEEAAGKGDGAPAAQKSKSNTPTRRHLRRIEFARSHRAWVEKAMAAGEISSEPEKDESLKPANGTAPKSAAGTGTGTGTGTANRTEKRPRGKEEGKQAASKRSRPPPPAKADKAASELPPRKKSKNNNDRPSRKKNEAGSVSAAASTPSGGGGGVENDDFFDT